MNARAKLMRSEAGMTLVELLIAMVVMSIGIAAIVEGFNSGIFSTVRATRSSSAGALADQQMESFRGLAWSSIYTATSPPALDATYTGDTSAYDSIWRITGSCGGQNYCTNTRTASAGGGSYRIDTYVKWRCPNPTWTLGGSVATPTCTPPSGTASTRSPVKFVTIVVRDNTSPYKVLFRESSSIDQALAG